MRRPFSRVQKSHVQRQSQVAAPHPVEPSLSLPLPGASTPPPHPTPVTDQGSTRRYVSFDEKRLEEAKRLLEAAGVDPHVLDKLVERIKSIDEEVEELEEELSVTRRRISELEEEKERLYSILAKFLAA